MSSHNCTNDVDPNKMIALVGTDKLDGTELDNVKTGLTPPNKTLEFFEHQCNVDSIGTPMRFDEDESLPTQLELQTQYLNFNHRTHSLDFETGIRKGKETEYARLFVGNSQFQLDKDTFKGYSSQLSSICLDDILPIINDEHVNINVSGLKVKLSKSMEINGHWRPFHPCDDNNPGTSNWVSNHDIDACTDFGGNAKPKKQFVCTYESCKRKFNRSDELNRHSRVHSGIKPYTCEFCFKKFARSDHLKTHRRTHTGERPFECEICQKTFARSDEKSRHIKTHTRGRELSRIFTVPNFEQITVTNVDVDTQSKQHRSSDGSITYKL